MGNVPPLFVIEPPLVNSSNPWATTLEDLGSLYACALTGAVTTRTSLINGYSHDPEKHCVVFLDSSNHLTSRSRDFADTDADAIPAHNASLNSLGYSPLTLRTYLGFIKTIASDQPPEQRKGFIVSVTGNPEEVAQCYRLIATTQGSLPIPLAMEINLSCPNITGAPPPAYSGESLAKYFDAVVAAASQDANLVRVPFGLKTPPYTHSTDLETLIDALLRTASSNDVGGSVCPVSFLTATNTLGSCLAFASPAGEDGPGTPALPGPLGTGGMAGAPLHPLALGNVATMRRMLDAHAGALGHVQIIGTSGVLDASGYRQMRAVGVAVVGISTGLGLRGVAVFKEVESGLGGRW